MAGENNGVREKAEKTAREGKKAVKKGEKAVKDVKKALDAAEKAPKDAVKKAMAPVDKAMNEVESSIRKAEQPMKILKAKQSQARASVDGAKKKLEAMQKIFDVKEVAHRSAGNSADSAIKEATSKANRIKQGVERKQREYLQSASQVQALIAKLEEQLKAAKPPEVKLDKPGIGP